MLMQLLGLAMPLSAAVILILCGIEGYTGVYVSRWVFWPFAMIFWCGGVLYPFAWLCAHLWYKVKMQK